MGWKDKLFKPPWENRDPEVRRQAVSETQDPRLLESLAHIAQTDEEPKVRAAAIPRLTDLDLLRQLLDSESDKTNLALIRQRIHQLLTSADQSRINFDQRIAFLKYWDQPDTLQQLAADGGSPELRLAALKKVNKQGFLGDRAINDPDAKIRQYAAAQIDQISTLDRVVKALRTRDKNLYRSLSERLQKLKLESGDTAMVAAAAKDLCLQLEKLTRSGGEQDRKSQLADIDKRWKILDPHVEKLLRQRFEGGRKILISALQKPPPEADPFAAVKSAASNINSALQNLNNLQDFDLCQERLAGLKKKWHDLEQQINDQPLRKSLTAETEKILAGVNQHLMRLAETLEVDSTLTIAWQKIHQYEGTAGRRPKRKITNQLIRTWQDAWTHIPHPNPQEQALNEQASGALARIEEQVEALEAARDELFNQAVQILDRLEAELEHGDLAKAISTSAELRKSADKVTRDRRWQVAEYRGRHQQLQGKMRELRDWQHWSNNKIRNRLTSEMEALPASGLHPDAMLARLKEVQKEWKDLEESEQIPGEKRFAASPWLWRKFNAACHKVFETAKPFLEKRTEIQHKREQKMRQLVDRLMGEAKAEDKDWKSLQRGLKQARREIRELDEIRPGGRQAMARRLRKAMDQVTACLDVHYGDVEKVKLKLIREAEKLKYIDDKQAAIEQAKQLQREWSRAGALWRRRDQELWSAFRTPIDPLFEKLHAEQNEQRVRFDAQRDHLKEMCQQAETIAALPEGELEASGGKLTGLRSEWESKGARDKGLSRRFQKAVDKYQQRLDQARQSESDTQRQRWHEKFDLCQRLESAILAGDEAAEIIKHADSGWPDGDTDNDQLLDQRLALARAALAAGSFDSKTVKDNTARAAHLCIQLEFLAGLESPKKDHDARMKYQVERLSLTLSDASSRLPPWEEAQQLEQQWLQLGPVTESKLKSLNNRFKRAFKEVRLHINQ